MITWLTVGVVLVGLAQALPTSITFHPSSTFPPGHPSPTTSPGGYQFGDTSGTDGLAAQGYKNLVTYRTANGPSSCTLENAARRKEWSTLSPDERKEYIAAVLCIQSTPNKYDASIVPGSRSRYDDFVANHIMGTNALHTIHDVGQFLAWHRYYVWNYERALREECGYTGYQPYWNWGKYAQDPINSPLFDGSDTSMSGNGEYLEHPDSPIPALNVTPHVVLPAGQGGGCVTTGPFKNFTVNLGGQTPLAGYVVPPNPRSDGLGYNPRCMRRDISQYTSSTSTTDQNTTDLITQNGDIASFQDVMQTIYPDTNTMGVHGGGHFTIAGDPGGDLHDSPGDPAFWLHHGMIDRVWWIWQNLDLPNRQNALAGTLTFANDPPSRNATLDDVVNLDVNNAPGYEGGITLRELMSTMDGPFCYVYE